MILQWLTSGYERMLMTFCSGYGFGSGLPGLPFIVFLLSNLSYGVLKSSESDSLEFWLLSLSLLLSENSSS